MNQEIRKRKSRKRSDDDDDNNEMDRNVGAAAAMMNDAHASDDVPPPKKATATCTPSWMKYSTVVLHACAVIVIMLGFVLRIRLHSGVECEMTYSMRHFVHLPNAAPHSIYRLLKFTDARDIRQQHLLPKDHTRNQEWSSTSSQDWCTPAAPTNETTTIVVYVPGHWGSFSQARSLGAHGLQWTRARDHVGRIQNDISMLKSGERNGMSRDLRKFVYDVYAIDFCEQGGAMHANFLYMQSAYVAQVVMTLVTKCGNPTIILVGHSMGGLVARSVPQLHPETRLHVHNLVTLATPHGGLPFGFDESIRTFYNLLEEKKQEHPLTIVSISGGLRDEMMPPEVCHLENNKSISLLANDITVNSDKAGLGMDHRAIVWCHHVLTKVREILHVMAIEKDALERQRRLETILSDTDYLHAVKTQRVSFRYGFWKSLAMESAMLYRGELLLGIYAITAGIYHTFPTIPVWFVPALVSIMAWHWSGVDNMSVVAILSLAANSVYLLLSIVRFRILPRHSTQQKAAFIHVAIFAILFVLIELVVLVGGYVRHHSSLLHLSLSSTVFATTVLFLPMTLLMTAFHPSNTTFLALFLPVWPFLIVGKLFMIVWDAVSPFDSVFPDLLHFLCVVCLPVYLQTMFHSRTTTALDTKRPWPTLYLLSIIAFGPGMVQLGGGYVVTQFLATVAWIDVFVATLERYKRSRRQNGLYLTRENAGSGSVSHHMH